MKKVTIYIQWKSLITDSFKDGQVKAFTYCSSAAAQAAIKRFTCVSWCRLVDAK